MKKILAMLLVLVMALTVFAACGSNGDKTDNNDQTNAPDNGGSTEAKTFVMPAMDVVVYVTFKPLGS